MHFRELVTFQLVEFDKILEKSIEKKFIEKSDYFDLKNIQFKYMKSKTLIKHINCV